MRKPILLMCAISTFFASCSKQNVAPAPAVEPAENHTALTPSGGNGTVITFKGIYQEWSPYVWYCATQQGTCCVLFTGTSKNQLSANSYELLPTGGAARIDVALDPKGVNRLTSFSKITVDESGTNPMFRGQ